MPTHFMERERPIDYLLIWVLSGRGFAATEGQRIVAMPGDLLTFEPGQSHQYGAAPEDPWDIVWVHYTGQLAPDFFRAIRGAAGVKVPLGLDAEICDRWLELVVAYLGRGTGFATRGNTALYGLLGLIAARLEQRPVTRQKESPLGIYALQKFIHDNLATPLTVATLAREAKLSVPHFTRLFKRQFAVSPMDYVIQKRVALAGSLLTETGLPLKQISATVGYDDPFYFSRLFKKVTGVSPSAYRARAGLRQT